MPASHSKFSRSDSEGRTGQTSKKSKKEKESEKEKKPASEGSKVARLFPDHMENYRPTHTKCRVCTRWADGLSKAGNCICSLAPIYQVRTNV